ncbi:hypothetical protein [Agromyces archimandritae]|uniref:Uncharacterized protein n=1 Tax=Agromyces archimandritae TaxID=2781962 RepID=A0A975FKA7_9MICO|nr:hypothetical protein [Agromyces archimandritae]QTX03492.1 hypothetical protein G127AT_08970 [Agromyces archimandritae]
MNAEGALVTRVLPYLSVEAAFSRFTGHSALIHAEMERITGELDPRLGISLREAGTPVRQVRYWEFVTPKLASFVSWSSVDRYEDARLEALDTWINDEFPHTGSLNALPLAALETCEHCDDEPITRRHPLAPGSMIGPMCDFESVVEIGSPFGSDGPSTWEELLLMHVYGGMQFVSHDGCAAYWSEEA